MVQFMKLQVESDSSEMNQLELEAKTVTSQRRKARKNAQTASHGWFWLSFWLVEITACLPWLVGAVYTSSVMIEAIVQSLADAKPVCNLSKNWSKDFFSSTEKSSERFPRIDGQVPRSHDGKPATGLLFREGRYM